MCRIENYVLRALLFWSGPCHFGARAPCLKTRPFSIVRWRNERVNLVVRLKMLKSLTGLQRVIGAVKRKENVTAKTRTSIIKREEKRGQKGANYAKNAGAHFHYALHPNSELNVLMKDYLRKLGNLRKEGKLNDDIQAEIKAEYEKQKKEIRQRLNEQFPNKFVDDEPQPEPEKPKHDIDKVFNHVHQLLMNDEFLEDYFMLFGKHKDRIIIEIPVDRS